MRQQLSGRRRFPTACSPRLVFGRSAKDTAQEKLNILVQRLSHARAAECDMNEGTSRARAWAICHTKSAASSLHLPPVSTAITTSRQRPDGTSLPCLVLRGPARFRPHRRFGCGCPSLLKKLRRVMSTASWNSGEARQLLGQHLDAPFVCSAHVHVHITQIRIELDSSLCLSTYSCKHLLGGCGSLPYPPCTCARCSVALPKDQEVPDNPRTPHW